MTLDALYMHIKYASVYIKYTSVCLKSVFAVMLELSSSHLFRTNWMRSFGIQCKASELSNQHSRGSPSLFAMSKH